MALRPAYIVAARRTALGRVGGLHRNRRVEDLAAPIVLAVLKDAGLAAERVDEVIVGNCAAGGNPARLIALSAGLPEATPATTIDQQCGSGLEAILAAIRQIGTGEAEIVVAGGAESLSTAPWRIAKPKSLYQTPHFIGMELAGASEVDEQRPFEASEALARQRESPASSRTRSRSSHI
jgi:acetyl-CoA C-acetyltransferase